MNLKKLGDANQKCNKVNKKNGPKDDEQILIAIRTEIGEFCNELQTFKWGKKSPRTDGNKALEEYCDILFFLFVYTEQNDLYGEQDDVNDRKDIKSLLSDPRNTTGVLINELFMNPTIFNGYVVGKKLEFNDKDIENMFLKKVEINLKRGKNNY